MSLGDVALSVIPKFHEFAFQNGRIGAASVRLLFHALISNITRIEKIGTYDSDVLIHCHICH